MLKRPLRLVLLLVVAAGNPWIARASQPPIVLNEELLIQLTKSEAPELLRQEQRLQQSLHSEAMAEEPLSWDFYSEASYTRDRQRPLISFQPIFSPIWNARAGVRTEIPYGVSFDANLGFDQRSTSGSSINVDRGTTVNPNLQVKVDLWKNLLGHTLRGKTDSAAAQANRARVEAKLARKTFLISLRKLYWALVANRLSQNLSEELLKQSLSQTAEARKRLANSIGDVGEVARYEAQVSSRKASLLYLKHQQNLYERTLRSMVPTLQGRHLTLDIGPIDSTIQSVMECTNLISQKPQAPLEYTVVNDLLKHLQREQVALDRSFSRLGDVDIHLLGEFETTGVSSGTTTAGTASGAFNDLSKNDRFGYFVGLRLTVPLSWHQSELEDTSRRVAFLQTQSHITQLQLDLDAEHRSIAQSIPLLLEAVDASKKGSQHLETRLRVIRTKYAQARVSATELINDQDALLNSKLSEISAQIEIVRTLLDYLSHFTETPCAFNQGAKL